MLLGYCMATILSLLLPELFVPRMRSQTETRYVQTEMNARRGCRAFISRPTCVQVQTIVRSPDHRAFISRPSCVHVQTIVRSSVFPDRVILNARHPLRAFISVWTYLVSVWDLILGTNSSGSNRIRMVAMQ